MENHEILTAEQANALYEETLRSLKALPKEFYFNEIMARIKEECPKRAHKYIQYVFPFYISESIMRELVVDFIKLGYESKLSGDMYSNSIIVEWSKDTTKAASPLNG
jgi:hypothetical protein